MVHWPETMVTHDRTDRVLFSMDAFGGFGALDGGIFDDEVDIDYYEDESLRYFSNIVGKYSAMVQKAIQKLGGLELAVVAPTHGPIWRKDPARIVGLYDRWSRHVAEPGVVIAYGSMYGNTERMMDAVAQGIQEAGFGKVRIHNVSRSHLSYILRDAWRFSSVVLGSPAYDQDIFPPMESLLRLLAAKKLRNRTLGIFGNFAWSGGAVSRLQAFAEEVAWPLAGPVVEAKCAPKPADLEGCRKLGRELVGRIRAGGG
jgi:flavorubredoxin